MEHWVNNPQVYQSLTEREIQVLTLILSGTKYQDITKHIFRSHKMVKYIAHILFKKFNVNCREGLTAKALGSGLFFIDPLGVKRGIKLSFKDKTFITPSQAGLSNNL